MNESKTIFWDACGSEHLRHDNLSDAVEEFLGGFAEGDEPEVFIVTAFSRMKAAVRTPKSLIELITEELDEDFGDPRGESGLPSPSESLIAAAQAFLDALTAEHQVWMCEPTAQVEINVAEWKADA